MQEMNHLCLTFEILLIHVFYLILELLVHQLKVYTLFFNCGKISATLARGLKFGTSLHHQLGDLI
jgi:hypothetical protein